MSVPTEPPAASSEPFEHTADVGLRVRAPTLDALFAEAGRGLCALLVEDPAAVEPRDVRTFKLEADDLPDLLVDWLSELLYAFESSRLLFAQLDVHVEGTRLEAEARGEPFNPGRHRPGNEVKAVTYHGLQVVEEDDGWRAEVILDI